MKAPLFRLQNVCLSIDDTQLLQNISFEIHEGTHTVVLGSNGAGKTLLSQILSGNLKITSGSIQFCGEDFSPTSSHTIKQNIGCVSPKLFEDFPYHTSVIDVVTSGLFGSIGVFQDPRRANNQVVKSYINRAIAKKHPESRQKALGLLKEFDSLDSADKVFGEVSQGQKIKILICRCLMTNPRFIILDEPTTGLDIKMRSDCMKLFARLAQKSTLLCVTHHFEEILPLYQQGIFLKNGMVVQDKNLSTIMTSAVLSDLYESDLIVEEINQKYVLFYSA